jgi:hypothetical protein
MTPPPKGQQEAEVGWRLIEDAPEVVGEVKGYVTDVRGRRA